MKKEKIDLSIVCDTPGCGNLATQKLTFTRTGASILVCDECMKEIADAFKKETEHGKANKQF